jgi:hypothetical protein
MAIRRYVIQKAQAARLDWWNIRNDEAEIDRVMEAYYRVWCRPYRDRVLNRRSYRCVRHWASIDPSLVQSDEAEAYMAEVVDLIIGNPELQTPTFVPCECCHRAMIANEDRDYAEYCPECVAQDEADREADAEEEAWS